VIHTQACTLDAVAPILVAKATSVNRLRYSQPSMHEVGLSNYRMQMANGQKNQSHFPTAKFV
jgi:hypothetical protein